MPSESLPCSLIDAITGRDSSPAIRGLNPGRIHTLYTVPDNREVILRISAKKHSGPLELFLLMFAEHNQSLVMNKIPKPDNILRFTIVGANVEDLRNLPVIPRFNAYRKPGRRRG